MAKRQNKTCGIIVQKENWKTCVSNKICKIKTKDAEEVGKMPDKF